VCYVTDGRASPARARDRLIVDHIGAAVAAGADWVQIREKDLAAKPLLALVREAVSTAAAIAPAPRILVNERLDVALAARAAGVHLGGESIPAHETIEWCARENAADDFSIGVSCHSLNEARLAESSGADYIFFGPVFDTPAKRIFGQPQGIELLDDVCRAVNLPVIAIGGINEENAAACLRAGAAGIAAIRLFQEPRDSAALADFISRLHASARGEWR
jgi:thiamine-phosphate pyrophosphorylase